MVQVSSENNTAETTSAFKGRTDSTLDDDLSIGDDTDTITDDDLSLDDIDGDKENQPVSSSSISEKNSKNNSEKNSEKNLEKNLEEDLEKYPDKNVGPPLLKKQSSIYGSNVAPMITLYENSELHTSQALARTFSFKPLVSRLSTFWPTKEEIIAKHPSLEYLRPDFDSASRKSSPISAIFNLVATVCGGGVLTLPIAFSRAGLIPSTILMIFSAILTDFSMYIICSCARRTGSRSYGDVARSAFGLKAEIAVTVLLFTFLCFVIIAFMVLVSDICTPVILYTVPSLNDMVVNRFDINPETSRTPQLVFLVVFIVVSLPLLLKKNLYALRHTCYVGFTSLVILVVAVVHRAYVLNFVTDVGIFGRKAKWWHDDINDIIFAFPIISLSFFSIYNVLSVHSSLINPTRERVKFVMDGTVVICFVLFYTVGVCGYLYSYEETSDNILLNFPLSCKLVFIGRIGFGFTLMFGLPLVFLPCRQALLTLPHLLRKAAAAPSTKDSQYSISKDGDRVSGIAANGHHIVNGVDFDEEKPLLVKKLAVPKPQAQDDLKGNVTYGTGQNENTITSEIAVNDNATAKIRRENSIEGPVESTTAHVLSTLVLLAFGFYVSIAVPGVGVIWGICGSSMALIIGFFLPAACYLKIRSRKGMNPRSVVAWFMIVFSTVASIVCTAYIFKHLK